jgi:hypothetical protein
MFPGRNAVVFLLLAAAAPLLAQDFFGFGSGRSFFGLEGDERGRLGAQDRLRGPTILRFLRLRFSYSCPDSGR